MAKKKESKFKWWWLLPLLCCLPLLCLPCCCCKKEKKLTPAPVSRTTRPTAVEKKTLMNKPVRAAPKKRATVRRVEEEVVEPPKTHIVEE